MMTKKCHNHTLQTNCNLRHRKEETLSQNTNSCTGNSERNNNLDPMDQACLTHLSQMEFPTLTNWTCPFPFQGMLDGIQIRIEHSLSKLRRPSDDMFCGI